MKKITELVPGWGLSALACAAALLLGGCGAATDGGLSNGPQMAATSTDVPENSTAPAATPEPASASEPAVAAADPAPAAPGAAGANAQPAAQGDSFAMTGYGSSMTTQAAASSRASLQGDAAQQAGQPAEPGQPAEAPADTGAATPDVSTPADPAAQASATPVPDGANRSYGPSGAGFPATEPAMCKYGGCSFR